MAVAVHRATPVGRVRGRVRDRAQDRDRGLPSRLLRRAASAVLALAVLGAIALALALTVVPAVAGGRTMTVLSGSMEPAISTGSVVVTKPVDPLTLNAGEVITFSTPGADGGVDLVTHRIARISETERGRLFVTKGDANQTEDVEPVRAANIQGALWYHVPWFGLLRDQLFSRTGVLFGVAGVLLAAGIWLLPGIRRRGESGDGEAKDDE